VGLGACCLSFFLFFCAMEVESLTRYDPSTGRFLVKWAGRAVEMSTWEVEENLAQDLVVAWDDNGGQPATTARVSSNSGIPIKLLPPLTAAINATALAAALSAATARGKERQEPSRVHDSIAASSTPEQDHSVAKSAARPAGSQSGGDEHFKVATAEVVEAKAEGTKYLCEWEDCNKAFASAGSRKRHTRSHTGEKPFVCSWRNCLYRSTQSGNLKVHMRIHTKEKPFTCSWVGCEFRSADSSNLKTHTRIHTGETPFVCREQGCGFRAAKYCTLKRHTRTHQQPDTGETQLTFKPESAESAKTILLTCTPTVSGEKPFVCSFEGCGYRAAKESYITQHARAHMGDKPFICSWEGCRFRAKESSTLKSHTRMHTGLQLARMAHFGCSKAGCNFFGADSTALKKHQEEHEGSSLTPTLTQRGTHVTAATPTAV
jgi:uncharacterized Zn-finger protein